MNKKLQKISGQINLNNFFWLNLFIHFAGPQGQLTSSHEEQSYNAMALSTAKNLEI